MINLAKYTPEYIATLTRDEVVVERLALAPYLQADAALRDRLVDIADEQREAEFLAKLGPEKGAEAVRAMLPRLTKKRAREAQERAAADARVAREQAEQPDKGKGR